MAEKDLSKFKQLLLTQRQKIMNSGVMQSKEDLAVAPEDLADEGDLANSVIAQQVTLNLREKELSRLRFIEFALQRIEDGSYGYCDDCGDWIGDKRLSYQPWADLCIVHAEEQERVYNRKSV